MNRMLFIYSQLEEHIVENNIEMIRDVLKRNKIQTCVYFDLCRSAVMHKKFDAFEIFLDAFLDKFPHREDILVLGLFIITEQYPDFRYLEKVETKINKMKKRSIYLDLIVHSIDNYFGNQILAELIKLYSLYYPEEFRLNKMNFINAAIANHDRSVIECFISSTSKALVDEYCSFFSSARRILTNGNLEFYRYFIANASSICSERISLYVWYQECVHIMGTNFQHASKIILEEYPEITKDSGRIEELLVLATRWNNPEMIEVCENIKYKKIHSTSFCNCLAQLVNVVYKKYHESLFAHSLELVRLLPGGEFSTKAAETHSSFFR